MKIAEFKYQLSTLNLEFNETSRFYIITHFEFGDIAKIHKNHSFVLDCDFEYFKRLSFDERQAIFPLLTRFSSTPIEEREECEDDLYQITIYLHNDNTIILKSPTNYDFHSIYSWFYTTLQSNFSTPIYLNEIGDKTSIELFRSNIHSMKIDKIKGESK